MNRESRNRPDLDLLFCFAVTHEAAPFRSWANSRNGIEIFLTGIGVQNAERSLRKRLEKGDRPRLLVSTGLAGGLNPELKSGDIVYAERAANGVAVDHPFARSLSRFIHGKYYCAHHVLTTVEEKTRVHEESQADVVEMESASVEKLAKEFELDLVLARVVLDPVDQTLPLDFNAVSDSRMRVRIERIIPRLIEKPSRVRDLIRFKKQVDLRSSQLASALRESLTMDCVAKPD